MTSDGGGEEGLSGCDERMFLEAVEGVMRGCVQRIVYH